MRLLGLQGALKTINALLPRRQRPLNQQSGGQGQPPDLDELWRDFTEKLRRLLGAKGKQGGRKRGWPGNGNPSPEPNGRDNNDSGGGDGGGNNGMNGSGGSQDSGGRDDRQRAAGMGLGLGLGVLVLLWMSTGFFTVQEGYQAVVLQFGRFHHASDAGFHWRAPYPFQSHEIVKISDLRSVTIGRGTQDKNGLRDSSMLTEDTNVVDVSFAVQYRLKADGAQDYLFRNRLPDDAVVQVSEAAVREIVGRHTMDFVLYEGRERLAAELEELIQNILDRYSTGILVTSVALQNVQVPDQVRDAFEDTQRAGQDRERQINEGYAYDNDIIPKARGAASRLLLEAEGYRAQVVARAQGDAARFRQLYEQYRKAPRVTRDRIYIDAMKAALLGVNKVVLDGRTANQLMYLPLDKLMRSPETGAAPEVPSPGIGNSAPLPVVTPGSAASRRDTDVLSRDR